jgi:kexin
MTPFFSYNETERPYYPGQWHLENKAKSIEGKNNAGIDANLRGAWNLGYTGKGVVIGILDDGVEGTHEDIKDNYNITLSSRFYGGNILDPTGPVNLLDNHGTSVAGVAGARGGNGIGGTGAAPYAGIVDLRILGDGPATKDFLNAYLWKSGVEQKDGKYVITKNPEIHIKNHSYHRLEFWTQGDETIAKAINKTAKNGVIHVWAAGNERGKIDEDSGKKQDIDNSNVITVAALGSDGKFADYSNYGSNVFVAAPSNRFYDRTGLGIITTDRTGADLGYNRWSADKNPKGDNGDVFPDTNYASDFGGTSSATPLVAGIMALGKEVNKYMDVRMAKHVLVQTSTRIDPDDASATGGWVKNGAGNWFNPNYGFGNINAGKFVERLKTVKGVTQQTSCTTGTKTVNESIKYINSSGIGGTSKTFTLTTTELPASLRQPLEGVEVDLNFTHSKRGDLTANITSPYTTKSCLLYSTSSLAADKQDTTGVTNFSWTFLSNTFWGEDPLGGTDKTSGNWTITMGDTVGNNVGTWNSYGVTLLMGKIVLSTGSTTTQTNDIKATSMTLQNSGEIFQNQAGTTLEVSEKIQITSGELNVNGTVKMSRLEDDEDDGEFILDGGTLSGTGTIDAPYGFYHMDGIIKPGNSIGTLTITGDYNQGHQGKLLIEIASTASNDLLAINGAADLSGILETSWSGGYIPAVKTKFGTILTASSGVTGQFSSLLTNITPTVLFKPKYDIPNQIYLMVERDYTNPHLIPYLNANQRAIASMLNSVGNSATGDLDTVLTALDALPAYGQTAYALDQLAPKGTEAQSGMGINGVSFQTGNLSERLSDLRQGIRGISLNGLYFKNGNGKPVMLASINPDLTGMLPTGVNERWGFFVKGNASYGNQKDRPDSTGYDFTNTGITIGSDYRFTKSLIAGLMFGLNTSRANVDNAGSKVKMDGYTLGTYGTYYNKNIYIDGSVSYGFANYDNTRRIVFPGLDRTATSSPDGSQFTAYTGAGYDIRKNNWIITPNVSLQYINLNTDSYTESGAGALSLDVDKQNTESLQGNIGTRLSYAWQTNKAVIMPNIRASYGYEFLRDSQNITSRLTQGSSPFSIQTVSPDRSFLSLGAGITAFTVRDMSVYINYDVQIGENKYLAHNVNAGLRVGF